LFPATKAATGALIAHFDRLGEGIRMSNLFLQLKSLDSLCAAFATALHNAEPQVYAALAVLLLLGVLLFPPKDDPDQI
jgi:hypothetical protein